MRLVDTHCHVETDAFPEGADAVLARAESAGVVAFVVVGVGETRDNAERALALARTRDNVVAAVGVHPHDAAKMRDDDFDAFSRMVDDDRVVAVGEMGLDYHYDHSPRDVQKQVFRRFVALAKAVKKPVVVHTREAAADTLAVLREEGARDVGGVIHCFSEDRAFAKEAIDMGFDISFSGIVTFKSAAVIQDVAAWAPAERILIETDSPYLAPVPMRGKRCEPAYVVHTAKKIAELRKTTLDEIARITTENAIRRFGSKLSPKAL